MYSFQYTFDAIGTSWIIDITTPTKINKNALFGVITKKIEAFDQRYSRFREDSLVSQMAKKKGSYTLVDAKSMLELYHELYHITEGAVTPLIGSVLEEAGYDRTYSLQAKEIHHPPTWDTVLDYTHPNLTIKKPAVIDFGAVGKGQLIDLVAESIMTTNPMSFCVDAGGDMYYYHTNNIPLRIGLENPFNSQQVIGVAKILNEAICGSAGNRRAWGEFHHIIDPFTLTSPKHIAAVWVIANTTLLADGLATALFFTSPQILQQHFSFKYCIVYADQTCTTSFDFPGEVFYNDQK